jgi:DNA-binding HxlR family transcriptional regulator
MAGNIADFLDRKWAVELLCEVDTDGTRFTELKEELGRISSSTLWQLLSKAVDLGLLDEEKRRDGQSSHDVYVLTNRGAHLRLMMKWQDVENLYGYLKLVREDFFEHRERFVEWVENNESRFDDPDANTRYGIIQQSDLSDEELEEIVGKDDDGKN